MQRDFDKWNIEKKKADAEQPRLYTVREIWWCRFGVNIGTEQDGRGDLFLRPVIILRGFGPDACLVAPLTTSVREHPLRIAVGVVDGRSARANLSQVRIVDTRRLVEKVGFLENGLFDALKKSVKDLLWRFFEILLLAEVRPKPTV
jgi:mRNA interferase MazF